MDTASLLHSMSSSGEFWNSMSRTEDLSRSCLTSTAPLDVELVVPASGPSSRSFVLNQSKTYHKKNLSFKELAEN